MSLNAATIEFLLSKGLSGEDLLEVARRSEMRAAPSSAAVRQKRYRDNKRNERDVTRDVTSPPIEDNHTPPGYEKTEAKASKKAHREKLQALGSCLRQAFPPPLDVPDAVWADFLNSPKRKKAGMSPTAYAAILKNLAVLAEHGFPPGEMIALAVERGWVTIKPEWVENERRTNSLGRHQPADGISSTARAALAVFGTGEH